MGPMPHSILIAVVAILVAIPLLVALMLMLSSSVSKRRKFTPNFPYLPLQELQVGQNALHVYSRGRELYDAMLAAIEYAHEAIYLESFLFKGDAIGQEFKKHLAIKAEQGVAVYIIYDGLANILMPWRFKRFPKTIHVLKYYGIRRPWHLLDPRRYAFDHRKLLVVDGHIAFVGGYNIGRLYASDWRDTHLRIRGPAAADLAFSFAAFWNHRGSRRAPITRHYPRRFDSQVEIWSTDAVRLSFPIRSMYIKAIERAETSILLTNAYFVPDRNVFNALRTAVKRGVRVELIVPWTSNHVVVDWLARGYFARCLRAGINIYGYRKVMIHAKTCTIDGQWSTIGTANLDRLSSVGNYEINAEIYSETLAQQLEALFTCDKTNCFEITTAFWKARPWYAKLGETLIVPLRFFV